MTANPKVVNAMYLLTSPDGQWTAADNGTYAIRVQRRSVRDFAGNAAALRVIGEFVVVVPSASGENAPAARFSSASRELLEELR